jgi:hypothetical protein
MLRHHNRTLTVAALGAALGPGMAAAPTRAQTRPAATPSLLARSQRLPVRLDSNRQQPYAWLDTDHILAWLWLGGASTAVSIDVRTGRYRALRRFNQRVHRAVPRKWREEGRIPLARILLSRDSRMVVWTVAEQGMMAEAWVVASLDGGWCMVVPIPEWQLYCTWPVDGCWLPDSRGWVSVTGGPPEGPRALCAVTHSIDPPRLALYVPMWPPDTPWPSKRYPGSPLGVAVGRRLIALGEPPYLEEGEVLYDFSLDPGGAPTRTHLIKLPGGRRVYAASLSPKGDAMAWFVEAPGGADGPGSAAAAELWMSAPDGTGLRLIARQTAGPGHDGDAVVPIPPVWPRWTPDARRISFWYDNQLWWTSPGLVDRAAAAGTAPTSSDSGPARGRGMRHAEHAAL